MYSTSLVELRVDQTSPSFQEGIQSRGGAFSSGLFLSEVGNTLKFSWNAASRTTGPFPDTKIRRAVVQHSWKWGHQIRLGLWKIPTLRNCQHGHLCYCLLSDIVWFYGIIACNPVWKGNKISFSKHCGDKIRAWKKCDYSKKLIKVHSDLYPGVSCLWGQ